MKRARGRGRGSCNTTPANPRPRPSNDNHTDDWIESDNKFGTVQDISEFIKVSELLESFTPNSPDDVLCYFSAFIVEAMFEKMATETNQYVEQIRDAKPNTSLLKD